MTAVGPPPCAMTIDGIFSPFFFNCLRHSTGRGRSWRYERLFEDEPEIQGERVEAQLLLLVDDIVWRMNIVNHPMRVPGRRIAPSAATANTVRAARLRSSD